MPIKFVAIDFETANNKRNSVTFITIETSDSPAGLQRLKKLVPSEGTSVK